MARFPMCLGLFFASMVAGAHAVGTQATGPTGRPTVIVQEQRIVLQWPLDQGEERGRLVLDLGEGKPLFEAFSVRMHENEADRPLLQAVDPVCFLVVGERKGTVGRPPGMSEFNEFFDSPASRPHQAYRSVLGSKHATVAERGGRATVSIEGLAAGPFRGRWEVTVYAGSRLIHLEAVMKTEEPHRAFLYDLALAGDSAPAPRFLWVETEGTPQTSEALANAEDRALKVRHRTLVAETPGGSVACFPPPHQYFFPRDLTDNQSTVWFGRNHRGLDTRFGFGIRQTERGGGSFVPWFNAPPGTEQRMGAFYLLTRGNGQDALRETLRYTNNDRFPALPGYHTFTSHFHMAVAVAALDRKEKGRSETTPDFVRMFKAMGVEIVHLADFHGDGHPQDPGPLRLTELSTLFEECRRLSDDRLLLIPGEEANVHFGISSPGQHPGHWLYLFPKPVYWTMKRSADQPFREERPGIGLVYHVGNAEELFRLLQEEHGLAWTAHPRIKASSWAPDAYRNEPYFRSDRWLGGAWKAMPADLSEDRLGRRVLQLMDDMANWGLRKYVPGEADVFKLDHTHEIYGHMNINYLALERIPNYDEGWKTVLDCLRSGRFFVTTGEVLIPAFEVARSESDATRLHAQVRWTFPLRFAEVISGDGARSYRERIDLTDTGAFGDKSMRYETNLKGRSWVRLEVWDVAGNGAFTQPVWLRPDESSPGRR
jgi:hypothetical protein